MATRAASRLPIPGGPQTRSISAYAGQMCKRVGIVHDYLTQRGGAERLVLSLLDAFPGASCTTSVFNPGGTYAAFSQYEIQTLWLNAIPLFRRDPRTAFPFLGRAFAQHLVSNAEVVVASSTGWAHGVRCEVPKVVYCHNPARWLYQPDDYFVGLPRLARLGFAPFACNLTRRDLAAARSATTYIANSTSVRDRIRKAYGVDAEVVHPCSSLDAGGEREPVDGVEPGYLLSVARSRGYKNTQLLCEVVERSPGVRLVVVGGLPAGQWSPRLRGVTAIPDAQLRWLYANAAGVVALSHEDFGLTPVEGYTFGRPSLVLRAGGYLDSSVEGLTSVFIDELDWTAVFDGVQQLQHGTWDEGAIRAHAGRFSEDTFQGRIRDIVDAAARRG